MTAPTTASSFGLISYLSQSIYLGGQRRPFRHDDPRAFSRIRVFLRGELRVEVLAHVNRARYGIAGYRAREDERDRGARAALDAAKFHLVALDHADHISHREV